MTEWICKPCQNYEHADCTVDVLALIDEAYVCQCWCNDDE